MVPGSTHQDRIEQHAARASAYIERYFESLDPNPVELVKARAALDAAIALVALPARLRRNGLEA